VSGQVRRSCRTCGWSVTSKTAGIADRAKRMHSCEWRTHLREQRARGEAKRSQIDHTPQPCLHKQVQHQHGTRACYVLDACRCEPCTVANTAVNNERTRQQAYGRWNGLVDAEPARRRIRSLMDQGMGLKRIVAVSDLSQGVLWKLLYGKKRADGTRTPARRIKPETEAKVFAVQLELADGAKVSALGTVRRIQALVALGWSQSKLADRLAIQRSNFHLASDRCTLVMAATDRTVRELYDELSMKLPPAAEWRDKIAANRARSYAKARGWLPPLAWDDEGLDDPFYVPELPKDRAIMHNPELDEAAIYRRMHGDKSVRLSKAEAAELVRRWQASGRTFTELQRQTGITPDRRAASNDLPLRSPSWQ